MGLYPGGLKSGINFGLEPEWAYIRVDHHSGFYGISQKINFYSTEAEI